MRTFTPEQIAKLSKNKNVRRCGAKSMSFRKDFKIRAVKEYNEEGLSAVGIFESAGLDLKVIGKRTPNRLMNQWNTAIRKRSGNFLIQEKVESFGKTEHRIGSIRDMKNLKAKVAYLQAENDFLAKLRARKRK